METNMDNTSATYAPDQFFDREVIDSAGHKLGTIDNVWADDATGRPAFIGLKTGWLSTGTYVIPAASMQFDSADGAVRLPYTEEQVRNAPPLSSTDDLTPDDENTIYDYYGVNRSMSATQGAGTFRSGAAATADATQEMTNTEYAAARREEYAGDRMAAAAGRLGTDREISVPLAEERLEVGKRAVEAGQVRIRKVVRTEHVSVPVELRSEQVQVERVAATRAQAPDEAFQEREISVPVMREEAVANKQAYVTGEAHIQKTAQTETRNVEGDIRKEDVVVDRAGVDVTPETARTEAIRTERDTDQSDIDLRKDADRASRDNTP